MATLNAISPLMFFVLRQTKCFTLSESPTFRFLISTVQFSASWREELMLPQVLKKLTMLTDGPGFHSVRCSVLSTVFFLLLVPERGRVMRLELN